MSRNSHHIFATVGAALIAATLVSAPAVRAAPAAPYTGLKQTIAVDVFQTPNSIIGLQGTSEGLTSMLTDALSHDAHYVVVERAALSSVAAEQQLGVSHATTAETSAGVGRLIGANLIVRGAVTKFDPQANSNAFSIGGVGVTGGHAYIAVTLRVIDTSTGQVVAVSKGEGTAKTGGLNISATLRNGQPLNLGNQHETPLGQAAEHAIEQAVANMDKAAQADPWSAMVIDSSDTQVFVNAGSQQNLAAGTVLHVHRKVRDLIDPATGVVLESVMADMGQIRITEVREKTSTAEVLSGGAPNRGDVLRLQ